MDWRDEIARRVRGEIVRDAPLAPRTAIRVGGPADLLVRPADPDALAELLRAARRLDVPLAKSACSTRATRNPRNAASRAMPAPKMPPPMTSTSNSRSANAVRSRFM